VKFFFLSSQLNGISNHFDDLSIILRDGIHTTNLGSVEYGKIISDKFTSNFYNKIEIPNNYPAKTKFCNIKYVDLNTETKKELILSGLSEVIGISQLIGPYTGLVDIDGVIYNNWDRWCYYEREMVNLKFKVDNISIIKVLQDDFDRSICTHPSNWSVEKRLKLKRMYYIGEDIKIIKCD
jgi:hypothetical protein